MNGRKITPDVELGPVTELRHSIQEAAEHTAALGLLIPRSHRQHRDAGYPTRRHWDLALSADELPAEPEGEMLGPGDVPSSAEWAPADQWPRILRETHNQLSGFWTATEKARSDFSEMPQDLVDEFQQPLWEQLGRKLSDALKPLKHAHPLKFSGTWSTVDASRVVDYAEEHATAPEAWGIGVRELLACDGMLDGAECPARDRRNRRQERGSDPQPKAVAFPPPDPQAADPDVASCKAVLVSPGHLSAVLVGSVAYKTDWRHVAFLAQELASEFPRERPDTETLRRLRQEVDALASGVRTLGLSAPIWFETDAGGDTWLKGDETLLPFRFLVERTGWADLRRIVREALSLFIEQNEPNPPTRKKTAGTEPRLRVENDVVFIDEKPYKLKGSDAIRQRLSQFITDLIEAEGEYIPKPAPVKTRDIENQDDEIRDMIESQPGAGTRIKPLLFKRLN